MVAARMSGSMAETPRKSVGLGFDSQHVINFPFLSNLVSCTGEHLATQLTSDCFRVVGGVNTGLMPSGLHNFASLSCSC